MSAIDWAGIERALVGLGGRMQPATDGLRVEGEGGFLATIRALPPPPAATSLRPIAVLRSAAVVPASRLEGLPPVAQLVHGVNRLCGAAAASVQDGGLVFQARVTLFEDDEAFWPIHAQLLAYAAVWGPMTGLAGMQRLSRKEAPAIQGASAWTPADFSAARKSLPAHLAEFLDKPSPHVLAANVPLPGRANPARVEIRADVPHPLHGPGLLGTLRLPVLFPSQEALAGALAALNAIEAEPIDAPPHYGAWSAAPDASVAYACFVPNAVKLPIIQLLLGWFAMRAPIAAAALSAKPPG